MPLEHFKTQVLLLHSQQSTLDVLSAGFGDRYAVHVATSGSEALNTLGETPIHVIVSAQDLPGMSGLEALREAKKRSPDTIGILLTGDARDDGLEALVSEKEVFQIVRGAVTAESLLQLVDQATKRVHLLTLAESANDHAADVDEPAGEHIVMETSENGATIISDGTARMRALRSQTVQVAPHAGGRDVDVLVVTKDDDFLSTIRDSSRGLHNVHHANTLTQAENIAQSHRVGILVTDAAMAGSSIEAITGRLRTFLPRLVAIVAGRRDDGEMLMDLINRGHVYRFLLKPVSPGRARLAIEASVRHHLEAADSAFRNKGGEGPAKPGRPAAAVKAAPARREPAKAAAVARRGPTLEAGKSASAAAAPSPAGERLDSAFRGSGGFAKTITGIAAKAGKSLSASGSLAIGAASGDGLKGPSSAKWLAIGAAALAVVAVGFWWLMSVEPPAAETAATAGSAAPAAESTPSVVELDLSAPGAGTADADAALEPPAVEAPPYQALLDEARVARQTGEIVVPAGRNAIELYVSARKMAPEDPIIAAELELTVNDGLALAEEALLNQRAAEAANALRVVRLADPQNARLSFLDAQVAQLELRTRIEQARVAIRESRFEDAAGALAAGRRVVGADRSEIDLVAEELVNARSAQRVDEVLTLAGQRLAENALTAPANDNARYYYELALSNDADNAAARQGLAMVASKLVLRAREAIDASELDEAERILQDAGALEADSTELAASQQALESARAAQEQAAQLAAEQQAAEQQAAEQQALAASAADAEQPGALDGASAASTTGQQTAAPAPGAQAPSSGGAPAARRTAGETQQASQTGPSGPQFVAISSLQRTNYVAPRYPRIAQRRGVSGWVDIGFTVLTDGSVTNIEIMKSDPEDVFEKAASEAVTEWRFEPPMDNGMPVERRVAVRMMFSLE